MKAEVGDLVRYQSVYDKNISGICLVVAKVATKKISGKSYDCFNIEWLSASIDSKALACKTVHVDLESPHNEWEKLS
jgi:hypothetical protein